MKKNSGVDEWRKKAWKNKNKNFKERWESKAIESSQECKGIEGRAQRGGCGVTHLA